MKKNYYAVFADTDEANDKKALPLGTAVKIAMSSPMHRRLAIDYLNQVIVPAQEHRQFRFFFNARGEPVGYIAWALVAPDVERRFIAGDRNLHLSEWNEGDALWIIDCVAPFGNILEIIANLRDDVFVKFNSVRYFRYKRGKVICKEIVRDASLTFFKAPQSRKT